MRLGVLALLLAGPAFAAPQILPPGTKAAASIEPYSRTPAYAKLIAQAVARVPAAVALRCAGRVVGRTVRSSSPTRWSSRATGRRPAARGGTACRCAAAGRRCW